MPELFQRILLPVDFAPVSREAFLLGLRLAHQFQAEVFLLHVIDTKSLDALKPGGVLDVHFVNPVPVYFS